MEEVLHMSTDKKICNSEILTLLNSIENDIKEGKDISEKYSEEIFLALQALVHAYNKQNETKEISRAINLMSFCRESDLIVNPDALEAESENDTKQTLVQIVHETEEEYNNYIREEIQRIVDQYNSNTILYDALFRELFITIKNEPTGKTDSKENYLIMIPSAKLKDILLYIFNFTVDEAFIDKLVDWLYTDALLILLEKMLTPYLNGIELTVSLEEMNYIKDNLSKINYLTMLLGMCKERKKHQPEITNDNNPKKNLGYLDIGYKTSLYLSDEEILHTMDNPLFLDFCKTFNITAIEADSIYSGLLCFFAIPEKILPFILFAIYLQYYDYRSDEEVFEKNVGSDGVFKMPPGEKDLDEEIYQRIEVEDKASGLYWAAHIKSIIPKYKRRFTLLDELKHIKVHIMFLEFLNKHKRNIDYDLNLYLYNTYFPLVDVLMLYKLLVSEPEKSLNKNYTDFICFSKIKPMYTKLFIMSDITISSPLKMRKMINDQYTENFLTFFGVVCECIAYNLNADITIGQNPSTKEKAKNNFDEYQSTADTFKRSVNLTNNEDFLSRFLENHSEMLRSAIVYSEKNYKDENKSKIQKDTLAFRKIYDAVRRTN